MVTKQKNHHYKTQNQYIMKAILRLPLLSSQGFTIKYQKIITAVSKHS